MTEVTGDQQRSFSRQHHANENCGFGEGEKGSDEIQPRPDVFTEVLQEFRHARHPVTAPLRTRRTFTSCRTAMVE